MFCPEVAVPVQYDTFFSSDDVQAFEVYRKALVDPCRYPWYLVSQDHVACFVEESCEHFFCVFAFVDDRFVAGWSVVSALRDDLAEVCFLVFEEEGLVVEDRDADPESFRVFEFERVCVCLVYFCDAEYDRVFYGVCHLVALQFEVADAGGECFEVDLGRSVGIGTGIAVCGACVGGNCNDQNQLGQ